MADNEIRKENKMGTMPVGRLLLSMSWPAMISMIIQALYNIVDSIFVAQVGENALAAVSLIFPVQFLMIAVGVGTAVGVNSLISRRLGARRFEEADLAASNGFRLAFINGAVFAVLGALFSGMFMRLFSDNAEIVSSGTAYMRIVTILSIFVMTSVMVEKIIQSTGSMRLPMIASISGAVVNIALDPLFIFGIAFFPEMGVTGAAIATVIGQMTSATINCLVLFKGDHDVKVKVKGVKFHRTTLKEIYAVGFPAILMQAIGSVMQFGMNIILAGFSTTAVAVMGVYGRLQSFVFMPVIGINQGSTPVFGYNYGARNRVRLMQAYRFALVMAFVIMGAGLILFQTKPHMLLAMFNATDDMFDIGMQALRTVSWCFLPAAFGIVSGGVFAATGHGFISLVASLLRQLVGILPLAVIFGRIGGVMMVWWSFPAAEIIGTSYIAIMMYRLYKKEFLKLDEPPETDQNFG